MSYECSQCGYAFEPFADEAVGPFCDCPRCGGLAVEQQGKAAPTITDDRDPFAEPENAIDPFGGKTGAMPLSPSLFGNYFAEAAGGQPAPAAGTPFDRVEDQPLGTGDIHREPTLLLPDDAPSPPRPRVAPREVTIPGLPEGKIHAAAADLLHVRPGRDIHDELTNLADDEQRPPPPRGGVPLEPAAQRQVEFGQPAEEPATFNMRIGEDGAAREVSDPGARPPRADVDIFGADERAEDDESTVVSPEPGPDAFDVDVAVDGEAAQDAAWPDDAARLDDGGAADAAWDDAAPDDTGRATDDEAPVDGDLDDAGDAGRATDDEAPGDGDFGDADEPGDDLAHIAEDAATDGGAALPDDDDDALSWNESPLQADGLDDLASIGDDEAALDLDDAFIQQLPRPPGMPDAHSAGMPEGSTPFASLLSGDMLVSADREVPRVLVSGVHAASGEMIVSGDHVLPDAEGGLLPDDDELSEVSDRLGARGAAEGDWVVSVPGPPPRPGKGKAKSGRPAPPDDAVAGLQLPALELPPDQAADRPSPPSAEPGRKAERKAKPAAGARAEAPRVPRFFSGTFFFIVVLVALAVGAAGVGAGFALVSAQKKAAPLTGPARARQLLGDAHRLLHDEKPREAIEILRRAASDDPTLAEIQRALGTAHAKLGDEAEAARAYSYYVRLAPNAPDAEAIRLMLARHRGEEP